MLKKWFKKDERLTWVHATWGFMESALIINGKVKTVGRVPMRSEIRKWLKETQKN